MKNKLQSNHVRLKTPGNQIKRKKKSPPPPANLPSSAWLSANMCLWSTGGQVNPSQSTGHLQHMQQQQQTPQQQQQNVQMLTQGVLARHGAAMRGQQQQPPPVLSGWSNPQPAVKQHPGNDLLSTRLNIFFSLPLLFFPSLASFLFFSSSCPGLATVFFGIDSDNVKLSGLDFIIYTLQNFRFGYLV